QPPKKGSSKKPEKSRTPILIDGLTKDEMSKEQLEDHIMRLREELDREREERNYFQLERDKVHAFWDITDRKLKEANAELKNLDKELEETEIKLQVEIKVYRQKMRHLLCEHQNTICELNADGVASKEALQAEQTLLEKKLRNDLASLLVDIHQVDTETPIMELKKQIVADESTNLNKTEKELTQVLLENKQVTENLTEIQEEIAVLQNKMKYKSKKFDNKKEIELNNLAFEHEMLQKKFKELQLEVAELHKTSAETIEKMKNKADAKHMQMEKKIQTLTDKVRTVLYLSVFSVL
uniref:Dynein regulatory complex subunit 4 n=1 Tax=Periophthalmus magnuspinnatus TaxID=409849 RepID=A0A3B3ZER6_9GOBI